MTDRGADNDQRQEPQASAASSSIPELDFDWEQEKAKVRVRQFLNILEQIPRLCSPTICGTLSQPTTKAERASRGGEIFEWSMEQKAILSPANITTDTNGTEEWHNMSELNPAWRQQESEMFFSQRTIAPSPLVTPSARRVVKPIKKAAFQDLIHDEDEEEDDEDDDETEAQDEMSEDDGDNDEANYNNQIDYMDDDMLFSPRPLKSSQQRMDIFSPDTFVRVMEDENTLQSTPDTYVRSMDEDTTTNTLQSTPKTTGSSQRARTRTRIDLLD